MIIYLLLVVLIIEFILSYYLFNKDLFSPSAVLSEVFILSTLACIYNIDNWGVNLHYSTFFVICGGNLVFIIVSYIINLLNKKNRKSFKTEENESFKYIEITNLKCFVILFIYVIFTIIFIKENLSIISILSESTGETSAAMNMYRRELVEGLVQLPGWLTKLGVILNLGAFVLMYVFINNMIVNFKRIKNYVILFCVLLYLFSSVFTSQRTTILLIFIYSLFSIFYNIYFK